MLAKGQLQGVIELYARQRLEPGDEWLEFLETYADQGAIAIENSQLLRSLERSNVELQRAYDRTIEGWAFALDLKDEETAGHSKRVTDMAVRLARSLGMGQAELVHLQRGALLHDIGKMGIPDHILLKGEELTDEEYDLMKRHTIYAYELLSPIDFLRPALDVPYCHHERWDGGGYPRGLAGEDIPLAARIFAVVDVFDALTSDRPYRPAWPRERALAYIRAESGRHFDPAVVTAFFEVVGED
jgi:putative nucleotidyltransferase with HDIG domain